MGIKIKTFLLYVFEVFLFSTMVLNRLSFVMFFIPVAIGINTAVSNVASTVNKSDNVTLTHNATTLPKVVNNSVGDLPIMTEGGSIGAKQIIATEAKGTTLLTKMQSASPDINSKTLTKTHADSLPDSKGKTLIKTLSDPLPNIKDKTLIKLQSDPLLDIPTKNTGKSVVGRKGVNFKEEDSAEENKHENAEIKNVATKPLKPNTSSAHLQPTKTESTSAVPHKPTVLSYGALESLGDKTMPSIKEVMKQKQATNPGSHPGMIMPVVITILVVPMFAVLGYMALRRGQEAWKNRHYKRMDFLLDGMYND